MRRFISLISLMFSRHDTPGHVRIPISTTLSISQKGSLHGPLKLLSPRCSFHSSWSLWVGTSADSDDGDFKADPLSSSQGYNVTAFEYFKDPRFFKKKYGRDAFVNFFLDLDENEKEVLTLTVHEFYQRAWEREKSDEKGLLYFFNEYIKLCNAPVVLEDFYKWKNKNSIGNEDKTSNHLPRMVKVDFQIKDSKLSHTYDLVSLSNHIDGLFRIYENQTERELYIGPFFCFVQSSGMGKTKLLWEYKKFTMRNNTVDSFLILPISPATIVKEDEKDVFDFHLDLNSIVEQEKDPNDELPNNALTDDQRKKRKIQANLVAQKIYQDLDAMLLELKENRGKATYQKIVLLFDESQNLLKEEYGYRAFRFRCVKMWLCEERPGFNVVAIFTGTNSKLTNFLLETDAVSKRSNGEATSRQMQIPKVTYYPKGLVLYPPFCRTTTMGSCLSLLKELLTKKRKSQADLELTDSEYKRALYYGRPLFARMAKENKLEENIQTVLFRMVRLIDWTNQAAGASNTVLSTWINVLSTRIQLGQTTADVASDLVANCYANFCGYIPGSRAVLLEYFPDPVCARLAMCMMDETFEQEVTIRFEKYCIKGQRKEWWTGRLKEIVSSGIVSPEKGDFGEVVVALYMLFCGDLHRANINKVSEGMRNHLNGKDDKTIQKYSQFSVSLEEWLYSMVSGGRDSPESKELDVECRVSVGFIQVCRNPLRSYSYSWSPLKDQGFLRRVYESGIAFYTCNNCPVIDMVVPLRIRRKDKGAIDGCGNAEFDFAPMLVSIKSYASFSQTAAEHECQKLKQKAIADGLERALCLVLVFGSEQNTEFQKDIGITGEKISDLLLEDRVIAKAIRIPSDDEFGLSTLFNDITPSANIEAGLLAAHPFILAHGQMKDEDNAHLLKDNKALYSQATAKWRKDYTSLRNALVGITPNQTSTKT